MKIKNNIRFTKKELENISKEIQQDLENIQLQTEFAEIQDVGMQQIKLAAQRYITFMNDALVYMERFEIMLKEMHEIRHLNKTPKKVQQLYARYERQRTKFLASALSMQILKETEIFQQALSTFLGQTLKTIYSYEGNFYDISNIPLERIVTTGYSSSNKFRGAYNSSAIRKIIANESELAPKLEFDKNITSVYEEVLRRYESSKKKVVFWKEKGINMVQAVQSKGSIEEAYTALAISRNVKFSNGGWTETDIGTFVKQGIMQVDNASGRLKGDFAVDDIEYAVKSLDASMVGIRQFIPLAEMVLMKDFTLEKLKQTKNEDEEKARPINVIGTILTNEVNNLIENYFSNF